jgi:hypothetical protein
MALIDMVSEGQASLCLFVAVADKDRNGTTSKTYFASTLISRSLFPLSKYPISKFLFYFQQGNFAIHGWLCIKFSAFKYGLYELIAS